MYVRRSSKNFLDTNFQSTPWPALHLFLSRTIDAIVSMTSVRTLRVLHTVKTPAEPDVLQFSPLDPRLLVMGTYRLERNQNRNSPSLFRKHTIPLMVLSLVSGLTAAVSCFRLFIARGQFSIRIGA